MANRPPIAVADAAQTELGKAVVIPVLANDTDPDDHPLTITERTVPPKGTATISTDKKSITYRPDAGFRGSDSFTYTVSDGRGGTALGSVAVTIGEPPQVAELKGCFADIGGINNLPDHDLNGLFIENKSMTIDLCTSTCRDEGFSFAGARNGFRCFCGDSYGKFGGANTCTVKCYGDKSEICGGYSVNSVYDLQ